MATLVIIIINILHHLHIKKMIRKLSVNLNKHSRLEYYIQSTVTSKDLHQGNEKNGEQFCIDIQTWT